MRNTVIILLSLTNLVIMSQEDDNWQAGTTVVGAGLLGDAARDGENVKSNRVYIVWHSPPPAPNTNKD